MRTVSIVSLLPGPLTAPTTSRHAWRATQPASLPTSRGGWQAGSIDTTLCLQSTCVAERGSVCQPATGSRTLPNYCPARDRTAATLPAHPLHETLLDAT